MKLVITFISIIFGLPEVNSIHVKDDYIKRELQEYPAQIHNILHYIQGKCHRTPKETVQEMKRKRKLILKKLETYKEVIKLNKHIEKEFKWIIEEIKDHKSAPEMIKSLRKDVLDICEGPPLSQQRDCTDLKKLNKMTGVHTIYPDNVHGVKVFCNMEVDGGGWSTDNKEISDALMLQVIQRRQDGTTNFYRSWSEYKSGFGSPDRNVWLGNANIHEITSIGDYELRVDLQDWEGQTWYAVYSSFRVGDESTKYILSLGRYTGTAGDSLRYQNGMKFSTYDQDNDAYKAVDCVARDHAGWWYNQCHNVNINGLYKKGKSDKHNVVSWNLARGPYYSLKFVRMMIRRH